MDDAAAVCATLYSWGRGVDNRDWDLVAAALCPDFELDYSSHRPGSVGPTTPRKWIAHARLRFATMIATQHSMTNPRVSIDGDTAHCDMYVTAWHVALVDGREDWCTIGGEYQDDLVHRDGAWLISRHKLVRRWTIGNPAVLNLPTAPDSADGA